jgi:hypothetical protein
MSELIRDNPVGHDGEYVPDIDPILPPNLTYGHDPRFSPEEARLREQSFLRNRFEAFAEQAEVDLSTTAPNNRHKAASTMVDFLFSVVDKGGDETPDELSTRLPGVAHAQKRVIERLVGNYYEELPSGTADNYINQRRKDHLEKYVAIADVVNADRHYKDLALLHGLVNSLEGQNRLAATEVYAAYGKHYEGFYGRHYRGSRDIARIAIGKMHPTPETRRVVTEFGHINDEDE